MMTTKAVEIFYKVARILFLVAVVVLGLVMIADMTGCRHNSNNPQVIVASNLLEAATLVDTVSHGLVATKEYLDLAERVGTSTAAETAPVRAWLARVARANDRAIAAIQIAESGGAVDWRTALKLVAAEAGSTDPSTFFVKNSDSQKNFRIAVASLNLAIAAITNSFGGQ